MKARIIDDRVKVYEGADFNSRVITELNAGTETEFGSVKKSGGHAWVAVMLPDGQKGFIDGDAKARVLKLVTLLQGSAEVHGEPSEQSGVYAKYTKGTKFYITDVVKGGEKDWVSVRDFNGNEGYIDGKVKVKAIPEVTQALGRKNMLHGALWCIGGIVVTAGTYAAVSESGGSYFVAWGAILFGAIQFFNGLHQYLTAPI